MLFGQETFGHWRASRRGHPKREVICQVNKGSSINPVVPVVAVFVIAATVISFGNRRQKPVLWAAFVVCVVMMLFPTWVMSKREQVDKGTATTELNQAQDVRLQAPIGYAPIWNPQKRGPTTDWSPVKINRLRLTAQIGVVVLVAGVFVIGLRTRRKVEAPEGGARDGVDPQEDRDGDTA